MPKSKLILLIPLLLSCLSTTVFCLPVIPGDIDESGRVDGRDLTILCRALGSSIGDPRYHIYADIDDNGSVDQDDISLLKSNFGLNLNIPQDADDYVPGEIVVSFDDGIASTDILELEHRYQLELIKENSDFKVNVYRLPEHLSLAEAIYKMGKEPHVEFAEPRFIVKACYQPNDPYYKYQWNFDHIGMRMAWEESMGSPDVIVAVVDSGVAYENYMEYCRATDFEDDVFVYSYNFITGNEHANDNEGHGTHVAGTIAQKTGNNFGVAGIAPYCKIMPVKVLNESGQGNSDDVADGIRYAADHGAKVVNLSLGSEYYIQDIKNACDYAYSKGAVVVAASGNDGESKKFYPAAYQKVIGVGAVQYDKTRTYYSNYGDYIDLVAPGGNGYLDQNNDYFGDLIIQQSFIFPFYCQFTMLGSQGTSMAAPHVSGVAALLWSLGIVQSPADVEKILIETADDLGPDGWDEQYGYGLLDAEKATTYYREWGWDN